MWFGTGSPASRFAFARRLLLLCTLAAGCGDADRAAPSAVAVVVDTVGGVERITSRGEAPRWTVTPVLEIGSAAGEGEPSDDEFARVSAVSIGPDGLVHVADAGNDRIAVFDTLGVRRDVALNRYAKASSPSVLACFARFGA